MKKKFIICFIVELVILFLLLIYYILQAKGIICYSSGKSMLPTMSTNSVILLKPARRVQRSDIILFAPTATQLEITSEENEKHVLYVKRVIGLPGETIEIKNYKVFINGKRLSENYINKDYDYFCGYEKYILDKNQYFVMGDNRADSNDSRCFGPITVNQIKHKYFKTLIDFSPITSAIRNMKMQLLIKLEQELEE